MKTSAGVVLLTSVLLGLSACARSAPVDVALQANSDSPPKAAALPGVPPSFNANRAMQYVKEIVAFGPRPIGSENHKKVENYILAHLKGDDVEQDNFEITAKEGKFPVHNIIAKFPGTRDGIIVIASHYDTNWPLRNINYVGANDGASSSALLLEIANQLRGAKRDGYLNIDRDQQSTKWLEDLIYQAATRVGYQSHFFVRSIYEEDDHAPFIQRGVPAADLIDAAYGYNNVFWHTTQDTVDKLSPKSLAIVGTVTLETLRLLDHK